LGGDVSAVELISADGTTSASLAAISGAVSTVEIVSTDGDALAHVTNSDLNEAILYPTNGSAITDAKLKEADLLP
jgi:hypothetical protein